MIGGETNQKIVRVLTDEYDLGRAGLTFKDIAPPDARRALESRQVRAMIVVVPLAEKYLSLVRGLFNQNAMTAPVLIPIESAGAIAEKERAYESFDVPKGTLRGSPPVPSDDLTTLRVSFYVVARKKLDNDLVADLTQALMNARRDLLGELPILAQVTAPDTDADAYLPVHPGAAAYYNSTQQSFLDKWGNATFLTPMILGGSSQCWQRPGSSFGRAGPQPKKRRWILSMPWDAGYEQRRRNRSCVISNVRSTGFFSLSASGRCRVTKMHLMSPP